MSDVCYQRLDFGLASLGWACGENGPADTFTWPPTVLAANSNGGCSFENRPLLAQNARGHHSKQAEMPEMGGYMTFSAFDTVVRGLSHWPLSKSCLHRHPSVYDPISIKLLPKFA